MSTDDYHEINFFLIFVFDETVYAIDGSFILGRLRLNNFVVVVIILNIKQCYLHEL